MVSDSGSEATSQQQIVRIRSTPVSVPSNADGSEISGLEMTVPVPYGDDFYRGDGEDLEHTMAELAGAIQTGSSTSNKVGRKSLVKQLNTVAPEEVKAEEDWDTLKDATE